MTNMSVYIDRKKAFFVQWLCVLFKCYYQYHRCFSKFYMTIYSLNSLMEDLTSYAVHMFRISSHLLSASDSDTPMLCFGCPAFSVESREFSPQYHPFSDRSVTAPAAQYGSTGADRTLSSVPPAQ